MPGRKFNAGDYRFGFNGMENEEEISSGHKNTKFRLLDTRIGRWTAVDPAANLYYSWSPYNLSMDSPIANSDASGATVTPAFTSAINGTAYAGVVTTLKTNHAFEILYSYLERDYDIYKVTEVTPSEIAKYTSKGYTVFGYYKPFTGFKFTQEETFIRLNPSIGITKSTVYEEVFHANQDSRYWSGTSNGIYVEGEAKVAKAFAAYSELSEVDRSSYSIVDKNLIGWGFHTFEKKLLLDPTTGTLNTDITDYFDDMIKSGTAEETTEAAFRSALTNWAKTELDANYNFSKKQPKNYSNYKGETQLLDQLMPHKKRPLVENTGLGSDDVMFQYTERE